MKRQISTLWILFLVSSSLVLGTGCQRGVIANTEIPDTKDNREVYGVVMAYKRALESRDVDALLPLISRKYLENNGTTNISRDDYGYPRLREAVLPTLSENIKAIQYQVIMNRIEVDGDSAWASYEYFYHFKFVEGGKEGWETKNDFNRLELTREQGSWRIVGGL